ncbi:MAG: hypothetical protein LBT20_08225 [Clostridiales bacterium]|jgi:hypothetical protein|nr:hypothetical protein [Clostridiales bacterium]
MRICEHCGAYMADSVLRCTNCGVKQSGVTEVVPVCQKCNCSSIPKTAALNYSGYVTDESYYTNPYQLSDINTRLNQERAQAASIAPYTVGEVNKVVPAGPTYVCKNCGTINSADDIYCVVCGIRTSDKTIRDALKKAQDGVVEILPPPPEEQPIPSFGESTEFSTSLNTLEAKLKPYIYNYNVSGDNNVINSNNDNNLGGGQLVCPFAPKEEPLAAVAVEDPALTQQDIERRRAAFIGKAKHTKDVKAMIKLRKRILALAACVLSILILSSFFIYETPYAQMYEIDNNENLAEQSAGIDVTISVFEIMHLDDMFDSVTEFLQKIGVKIPEHAYYRGAVQEREDYQYTYFQKLIGQALPFTLVLTLVAVILNIGLFLIKLFTGNLKKKFYFVSAIQLVLFVVAVLEILIMTVLMPDAFPYAIGFGIIAAAVLSLLVFLLPKFFGKEYPKSEKERIKSYYGY